MKRLAFLFFVLFTLCSACTDEDAARSALTKQGFTDINVGGYAFMSCSDDDTFKTKFSAKNPNGVRVDGVVCCGIMKSCTVRW